MNLTFSRLFIWSRLPCFILALKWMSAPATARRGVISGEVGMLLAVVGTLLRHEVVNYEWIVVAPDHRVPPSACRWRMLMPMTARAAADRDLAGMRRAGVRADRHRRILPAAPARLHHGGAVRSKSLLGFLTITASLMAFGKLQEILPSRPVTSTKARISSIWRFFGVAAAIGGTLVIHPENTPSCSRSSSRSRCCSACC